MSELHHQVETILMVLSAHSPAICRQAIRQYAIGTHRELRAKGWKPHRGADIPAGHNWTMVNGQVFVQDREGIKYPEVSSAEQKATARNAEAAKPRKTDTDVKPAPEGLVCPICGEQLFKEGVCPGCEDGRRGYRIRLLCGACDYAALL